MKFKRVWRGRSALVLATLVLGGPLQGVASAASDTSPPVLTAISLATPGPFSVGDAFAVNYKATDNTKVTYVRIFVRDSSNKMHWLDDAGTGTATIAVPETWAGGTASLADVVVFDAAQNYTQYEPTGRKCSSNLPCSTHSFDLANVRFDVDNPDADVAPPVLHSIGLDRPGPFGADSWVQMSYVVTDESGVSSVSVGVVDAVGREHSLSYFGFDNVLGATIDKSWATGESAMSQVTVGDLAGNYATYMADGTYYSNGHPPATHNLDFSEQRFLISNPQASVAPPILESVSLMNSGPLDSGDTLSFRYSAKDESGITSAWFEVTDAAGTVHEVHDTTGAGTVSVPIDATWADGRADVSAVVVWDNTGIFSEYRADGTLIYPEDGRTTHQVNLNETRIWVGQDTTGPTVSFLDGPGGATESRFARFVFKGQDPGDHTPDLTFACAYDGGDPFPCVSPLGQNGFGDGAHSLSVSATDSAGNAGPASTYSWTVDTTGPVVTLTSKPAARTANQSAGITFTAVDPGHEDVQPSYRCIVDMLETACAGSLALDNLANGRHYLQVIAFDALGNVGNASWEWIVDATAPQINGVSAPSGLVASRSATVSFAGADSEGSATVFTCALDQREPFPCTSPLTLSGLTDGTHSFSLTAVDSVGNRSATVTRNWAVDAAPNLTVGALSAFVRDTTPTLTFRADGAARYTCQVDAGPKRVCRSPFTTPALTPGKHSVTVRASDAAGNVTTAQRRFTVDTSAPDTRIVRGPGSTTTDRTPTFRFASTERFVTYTCRVDGGFWQKCGSSWTPQQLSRGKHTLQVRARDRAGNTDAKPARYTFRVR